MHPTIADVLARPEVRAGAPAVRAGRAALGTPVRWVHVSEVADPAGTLPPGVLVLSVGVPVADPTTVPARYVDALRAAGAVGLVVEIGRQLPSLPAGLVQAARAAGFPLVELRRTVRFAEIVAGVLGQVARRDDDPGPPGVEAAFRTLALHRVPPGRVVGELARRIDVPVVCEDLAHRVLLTAGGPDLRDWAARSRLAGPAGPEGWATAPVGRPGARWGRLAVPSRPTPGTAERVRALLDAAADAVSLLDPSPEGLLRSARDALVADLAVTVPSDAGRLAVRARAVGLDTAGPLSVVALRPAGDDDPGRAVDPEQAVDAALAVVAPGATVVSPAPGELVVLVPGDGGPLLAALPATVAAATAGPGSFAAVADLLRRARDDAAAHAATGGRGPVRVPALRGLVHRLGDDPALLGFAADVLGPVTALPAAARADARDTLWALVGAGGVVADVARRLGVGRPAAYARLRRLSGLLGLDLTDPEVRTALHMALLVDARAAR
ncbi:PucR family transcriptional regulator ligand-binding domain-containing protein [Pseudonocardia alni]|uniref:Purine catabolism regulator n=1 Tax=Pseudonocardia alni TaxID=33907 RepID=A0AA44ZNI5_PSEA5|nr:PucR family transcriptional regulator ligand-binding domain-containing protein [Pseudonocardia alni]PKB29872.1 purine catabolism regulator [Pseudonocardia alni]